MPAAVCLACENSDISAVTARAITRVRELDDVDLETLCARGGCEFEADEAGADHDHAQARHEQMPQRLAFVQRPQISHRIEIGVGNIEQAVARAGREHQMPVIERRAGGECNLARAAVDRAGAIGDQIDLLIGIELVRPEHQAVRSPGTLQIGFRQRRPLIRQMSFVVDQRDGLGEPVLTQRGCKLKAGVPGTDNDNRSYRHRNNPTASAQEQPMPFPLSSDAGWLASSSRRSCPRPERWLGAIWPQRWSGRKSPSVPRAGLRWRFAAKGGIVTPSHLRSNCRPDRDDRGDLHART